jgi:CheY-like chemotaxis protein
MKTLKVLVVDDNQANIEAAKLASKNFPQHEFLFATSANEAFKQIGNFDAVITDLFFPEKPCEEIMETFYY